MRRIVGVVNLAQVKYFKSWRSICSKGKKNAEIPLVRVRGRVRRLVGKTGHQLRWLVKLYVI